MATHIIVIKEPLIQSIARDLVSVGALIGAVGLGVYLDSQALQWIAGIVWLLILPLKAFSLMHNSKVTIEQARQKLDEIEAA
jgi:hypothetical protein